ncbi:hypothetical protein EDB83DRAFT_2553044 [Lactarius deliciosus]|nr:hypothetical protein EDB83DRAFT_2553044 [Lactarius deliciosus]
MKLLEPVLEPVYLMITAKIGLAHRFSQAQKDGPPNSGGLPSILVTWIQHAAHKKGDNHRPSYGNTPSGTNQPVPTIPSQRRRLLCPKTGNDVYQEIFESLGPLWDDTDRGHSVVSRQYLMERQLWRRLDLRDALSTGMTWSQDTYSALYIGTFRAITSGWRQHKDCIGAQLLT